MEYSVRGCFLGWEGSLPSGIQCLQGIMMMMMTLLFFSLNTESLKAILVQNQMEYVFSTSYRLWFSGHLEKPLPITPISPFLMLPVGFSGIHFPSIPVFFHSTFKVVHSLARQTQLYPVPRMLRHQLFDTDMYRETWVWSLNALYMFTSAEQAPHSIVFLPDFHAS